ncbi:MAG: hypothetical protein Kow0077_31650 [Anaerolineae bacterium]
MAETSDLVDYRAILDGLGPGILLFDTHGTLILDNWSARNILGRHLPPVRNEGWPALVRLAAESQEDDQPPLDELREQALRSAAPVRFHLYFSGAYTPCWVAAVYSASGAVLTLVTLERPDWSAITDLMATFRSEVSMSLSSTRGHAEIVRQILRQNEDNPDAARLAQRVMGFTELIATHMLRLQRLTHQLHRLEVIRTGALKKTVREARRKLRLDDFVEDFLEELVDEAIADPDMGGVAFRDRLHIAIPTGLQVYASPTHLGNALHDTLRNAACYSPPGSPIHMNAYVDATGMMVQIEIIDQGYGIRASEYERIFRPFDRAHQPQIIGIDGYGLSLYLTRTELQAMGGSIEFASAEGRGTTFTIRLPRRPLSETHH